MEPGYKMPHFDPLIVAHDAKQEFLRGDRDAVYYLTAAQPNFTHNRGLHRGLQVPEDNKASIIDSFRISCAGHALPDPQHLNASSKKLSVFRRDTQEIN